MPKVRSWAVMEMDLQWEGHVPDDVPEDERWEWIKDNVDGSEFFEIEGGGSWSWGVDVEVIDDE